MNERGALFSAPMVLAIQKEVNPKCQTRRLHGLEKVNANPDLWTIEQEGIVIVPGAPYSGKRGVLFRDAAGHRQFVPAVYAPDTVLYVREAWRTYSAFDSEDMTAMRLRLSVKGQEMRHVVPIQYEADKARRLWLAEAEPGKYRHARFMPRWASRIDLSYIGERVERLNDISEEDAIAEGVSLEEDAFWVDYLHPSCQICTSSVDSYRTLWESLNGQGSWDANPFVRVIKFTKKSVASQI